MLDIKHFKLIKQKVFRNIVRVIAVHEALSDLIDPIEDLTYVSQLMQVSVQAISQESFSECYSYKTAAAYPFSKEPYLTSRYSDGTYPVWYGSLEEKTTFYETTYHALRFVQDCVEITQPIVRYRSVYHVECDALLIDLTSESSLREQLISCDYQLTQQLAYTVKTQGYPGILSPSARWYLGHNTNIFRQDCLGAADKLADYSYQINPSGLVDVYDNEKSLLFSLSW